MNHLLADEVLLSGLMEMAGCPADSPEHECATGQQLVFTSDVGLFFSVEADQLWLLNGNVLTCPRSETKGGVCTGFFPQTRHIFTLQSAQNRTMFIF